MWLSVWRTFVSCKSRAALSMVELMERRLGQVYSLGQPECAGDGRLPG